MDLKIGLWTAMKVSKQAQVFCDWLQNQPPEGVQSEVSFFAFTASFVVNPSRSSGVRLVTAELSFVLRSQRSLSEKIV